MSPETKPVLSLHRKLATIMYEADRIPKNGTAPQAMGGYKFVQVGDAADYIRKALAEKVITMIPVGVQVVGQVDRPTKSGGTMTTVDLITTWRLTDGETGESIEIQSFGAGADGGDKYSGKASTSAMKYALLTGFLLSTGEDSELGGPEAGKAAPQNGATAERAAAPPPPDVETEELMGDFAGNGMVRNGGGAGYKLEARQGPDGHVIGFRLEFKDQKDIPQVIVAGPAGEALFLATSGNPAALLDTRLHVKGRLFNVKRPSRGSYKRLKVTEWSNNDYKYPADEPELPEPPPDVALVGEVQPETAPLFDDELVAS
jgi:hypothetical protein